MTLSDHPEDPPGTLDRRDGQRHPVAPQRGRERVAYCWCMAEIEVRGLVHEDGSWLETCSGRERHTSRINYLMHYVD